MCKMIEKGLVGLAPRRKRAGYTQASFAEALGIERARLSMWEIGQAWPSAAWLPAIADLLACSIDELYELPPEEVATPQPLRGSSPDQGSHENGPPRASAPTDNIISRAEA